MTEKMNSQNHGQFTEKQTTDQENKPNYTRRRRIVGGAAIAALAGGLAFGVNLYNEGARRAEAQLTKETKPSAKDRILDAIERYDDDNLQIEYQIPQDGTVSEQIQIATETLREDNEDFDYPDDYRELALVNANMVAHDIEAITGRGVRPGDSVTTWYDLDLNSFVSAATESLPRDNE